MTKHQLILWICDYFRALPTPGIEKQIEEKLDSVIAEAIADHDASKWKKYPENKPTKGEYWIQLINGNNEACDYASPAGWQGRFNHEVIAFRELPEPYQEGGEGNRKTSGCWNCGKPIQYYNNGQPHYHCECGAENPKEGGQG